MTIIKNIWKKKSIWKKTESGCVSVKKIFFFMGESIALYKMYDMQIFAMLFKEIF